MTDTKPQSRPDTQLRSILIKGARSNNLKNIDVEIPKNQLVVVTGLSGSGKSSLVMDTLYSEGQRRYVESLSSYARQFLNRMKKPDVDFIKGICPAIAVEQKVSTSNARSTVGSLTEINDYLRLLYARVGRTISPISGNEVKKHTVTDVINYLNTISDGAKVFLYAPFHAKNYDRSVKQELTILLQKGFTRISVAKKVHHIEEFLEGKNKLLALNLSDPKTSAISLLVDRFVVNQSDDTQQQRLADSIQTAMYEGEGMCVLELEDGTQTHFSNRYELDGIEFIEPVPDLFNYNNPFGACPRCEGFGRIIGIDQDKVIPDPGLSIYAGAIACWSGEKSSLWLNKFILAAEKIDFPIHRPYEDLSAEEQRLIWKGIPKGPGIDAFFEELASKAYKIQNRIMLARFRGRTICSDCDGGRLRKEATYIKIDGHALPELTVISILDLRTFFDTLSLSDHQIQLAKRILLEIRTRLRTLCDVGLGYLTLERQAATLSGGETQRINLTRLLGSNLTSSLYLLDEPSVGLHPRDTQRLVAVLKTLRDLGNTVVVVEHEEEVVRNADTIIDIGPGAGIHGGHLVYAGPYSDFLINGRHSLTYQYLNGDRIMQVPSKRRAIVHKIKLTGARKHNLKKVDVTIPLQALTVVTGVSGSGKTTLVKYELHPLLQSLFDETFKGKGMSAALSGDIGMITQVEMVSQNPIGRSSRSNPVTYVKAYDPIRELFCDQQLSNIRGYKPKHFSFNVEGGRCETCKGDGEIIVEMQFLADVKLECDECKGQRFKKEILEVTYKGKNVNDVLNLSIEEAMDFFKSETDVIKKIKPLADVGLGYIKLGQPSSTLSGGEAQRVKLASFLGREHESGRIVFIFDEPTTGLHFHDIEKLLTALNALVEQGHTVVVIEHNMEVIKSADWVIDLGPEGGDEGGYLVFEGRPEDLVNVKDSYTGFFLKEKLLPKGKQNGKKAPSKSK